MIREDQQGLSQNPAPMPRACAFCRQATVNSATCPTCCETCEAAMRHGRQQALDEALQAVEGTQIHATAVIELRKLMTEEHKRPESFTYEVALVKLQVPKASSVVEEVSYDDFRTTQELINAAVEEFRRGQTHFTHQGITTLVVQRLFAAAMERAGWEVQISKNALIVTKPTKVTVVHD